MKKFNIRVVENMYVEHNFIVDELFFNEHLDEFKKNGVNTLEELKDKLSNYDLDLCDIPELEHRVYSNNDILASEVNIFELGNVENEESKYDEHIEHYKGELLDLVNKNTDLWSVLNNISDFIKCNKELKYCSSLQVNVSFEEENIKVGIYNGEELLYSKKEYNHTIVRDEYKLLYKSGSASYFDYSYELIK